MPEVEWHEETGSYWVDGVDTGKVTAASALASVGYSGDVEYTSKSPFYSAPKHRKVTITPSGEVVKPKKPDPTQISDIVRIPELTPTHPELALQFGGLGMDVGVYEAKNLYEVAKQTGLWEHIEPFIFPWEYEYKWRAIPPGGEPWAVPEIPQIQIVKRWHTGTAEFAILSDGRWAVLKKDGTWKIFRKKNPYIIPSQHLSYKGATRLRRAANKYLKFAKKIAPILGYKVTRSRRTRRK
ncbi:MAG: hypothetical protein DRN12_07885 [Thermoplasmata archaeon]|nr:MAG: hypothetical protein DRN12_07885 [Thermoplasmata archaeon]